MKIVALPYLQAASVSVFPWQVVIHGQRSPLESTIKQWDYQTPLWFESLVQVRPDVVQQECGLGPDSKMALVAIWWASSTNFRRVAKVIELDDSSEYMLGVEVPAGEAGGTLTLIRQLVLVEPGHVEDELAADQHGAILWTEPRETRGSVVLEGEAARFPTEAVNFEKTRVADPQSLWWLDADLSDLDVTPLSAMRLYLNQNHALMKQLLAGDSVPLVSAVAEILEWDVTRILMDSALSSDEFVARWGGFRPGSLGEVLELLIKRYWPGDDSRSLAALKSQDPGVFVAKLQGRMTLLGNVT